MPQYCLAGITINSTIKLPLPVSGLQTPEAEASVSEGPVLLHQECPAKVCWDWEKRGEAAVGVPGLGRAWISQGRTILLRPCKSDTEWRGLLIPCFAALLHQRGILCLHASAVSMNGCAVGFLGPCGAGKSTIVAGLVDAGCGFLADDLLILEPRGASIVAFPGFGIIKLWEDAARKIGNRFARVGRLYPEAPKEGFTPCKEAAEAKPLMLRALFVLEEGADVLLEEIPKQQALAELLEQTYGVTVFADRPPADHFLQCGAVASRTTVYRLTRPMDFARMEEVRDALLQTVGALSGAESGTRASVPLRSVPAL